MNKILAIIPARGGSKGLPGKNIKPLLGKPLIAYTIDVVKSSKYPIDVVISTDSEEIESVSKKYGASSIMRPAELASDNSLVIDAILYTVSELEKMGKTYDIVLLLEPTSPLRPVEVLDRCIDLVLNHDKDCVATLSEIEVPLERIWKINNNEVSLVVPKANPSQPRQMFEKIYKMNGLVYAIKMKVLKNTKKVITDNVCPVITEVEDSMDIDTLNDFQMIEYYMNKRNKDAQK